MSDTMVLSALRSRLFRRGRRARAMHSEKTLFPACALHAQEAAAVHDVLERLARRQLRELDPEATIEEVVARPTQPRSLQGLTLREVAALVVELEAKYGITALPRADDFAGDPYGATVLRALLGPAAKGSTWTGESIWPRSVRSVINERVRCQTGCVCT